MTSSSPNLADPHWFPFDLDIARGNVHFLYLDEARVERAAFIDVRLQSEPVTRATAPDAAASAPEPAVQDRVVPFPLARIGALPPQPAPAWLWHTSFCGSTLLARMLHLSPHSVSLREPLPLRRLSDTVAAGMALDAPSGPPMTLLVAPLIALLARPWHPQGRVVIKPTHAALNIAPQLMAAAPESRGLILTSPLEEFLVSHLKKTEETLAKVGVLAQRALRAGGFARRLPAEAFRPPGPIAAAALQWAAQRELIAEWRDRDHARLKVFDWALARGDLPALARDAADWLRLDLPDDALRAHALACASVHAKAPARAYGVEVMREEARWLRSRYAGEVTAALRWAERHVLPWMRSDAFDPMRTGTPD